MVSVYRSFITIFTNCCVKTKTRIKFLPPKLNKHRTYINILPPKNQVSETIIQLFTYTFLWCNFEATIIGCKFACGKFN